MQIKFKSDMNFSYGVSTNLSNKVRRIIAKNPSNFTLHGTGTYIIGKGDVAIIDPGPDDDEHINSILNELKNENVTHIFVTHTHKDHSSAANKLHNLTKAPLYGFGKHRKKIDNKLPLVEEGADYEFSPNIKVRDNNIFEGETWKLRAIHTPGHTSNHLCYELIEEKTLFSGDHLMGWSTTVISPPDGSMEDYLKSLKKSDQMIRNYGIGAQIIKSLNIKNMILVTRSPKKIVSLEGFGLKITRQEIIK